MLGKECGAKVPSTAARSGAASWPNAADAVRTSAPPAARSPYRVITLPLEPMFPDYSNRAKADKPNARANDPLECSMAKQWRHGCSEKTASAHTAWVLAYASSIDAGEWTMSAQTFSVVIRGGTMALPQGIARADIGIS